MTDAAFDHTQAWDGPLSPGGPDPSRFETIRDDVTLAGERLGEGPALVLLHGLSAGRRYVLHGSKVAPRRGLSAIAYDARGHGESRGGGQHSSYDYPTLAGDLAAVIAEQAGQGRVILAGHSMGAHTCVAYALESADRVAGLVLIGPATRATPPLPETLAYWGELASALDNGGVDAFLERLGADYEPEWRERVLGFTRERMAIHRDLQAVARALREVPASLPFEGLGELEFLDVPALVVASHDAADPGHPYAVAEEWSQRLPQARLLSEPDGAAPLAWQGGRLSREILRFAAEPPVRERLGA